jgi:hypothetical protein
MLQFFSGDYRQNFLIASRGWWFLESVSLYARNISLVGYGPDVQTVMNYLYVTDYSGFGKFSGASFEDSVKDVYWVAILMFAGPA